VLSWINLINKIRTNKLVHWTWYEKENKESITLETNGVVEDLHYSENGHIKLASEIINSFNLPPIKNPYNQNIL
jgi:hypothetical protein